MKFLTKAAKWVKQEYIIDNLMINQMAWITLFCWLPA